MATTELDPLFVKALRLLHSKSKDSADQLKQMLDDVRNQRKGQKVNNCNDIIFSNVMPFWTCASYCLKLKNFLTKESHI